MVEQDQAFLVVLPLILVALRLHRISYGRLSTELQLFQSSGTLTVVYGALAPVFPYLLFLGTFVCFVVARRDWRVGEFSREPSLLLGTVGLCLLVIMVLTVPLLELAYAAVWWVVLLGGFYLVSLPVMRDSTVHWRVVFISAILAFLLVQVGLDNRPWNVAELILYSTHPIGVEAAPAGVAAPPGGAAVRAPGPMSYMVGYVVQSSSVDITVMDDFNRTVVHIAAADLISRHVCDREPHGFAVIQADVSPSPSVLEYLGEHAGDLATCSTLRVAARCAGAASIHPVTAADTRRPCRG